MISAHNFAFRCVAPREQASSAEQKKARGSRVLF